MMNGRRLEAEIEEIDRLFDAFIVSRCVGLDLAFDLLRCIVVDLAFNRLRCVVPGLGLRHCHCLLVVRPCLCAMFLRVSSDRRGERKNLSRVDEVET